MSYMSYLVSFYILLDDVMSYMSYLLSLYVIWDDVMSYMDGIYIVRIHV